MNMWHYLAQYGHIYLMHFGAWVSIHVAMQIKDGVSAEKLLKEFPKILKTAAITSLFSSFSHNHYKSYLGG